MLLEARNLKKHFKERKVLAVDGVSFSIGKEETLGLVGESGGGKSTLAKLVLGLLNPDEGEIHFEGKRMGAVFQHPYSSLDPGMRVRDILKEPFLIAGERDRFFLAEKVRKLLLSVELPEDFESKRPRELSGGECQRIAIARAVSMEPALVVCDEPVSALDVFVSAGILNLLLKLQKEKGVSYLFISHNLKVVRHMSDRVLMMKDGKVSPWNGKMIG